MKFIAIVKTTKGNLRIKAQNKGTADSPGEVKLQRASDKVIEYAKKALKEGDLFKAEFKKGEIIKITKLTPRGNGGKKGYNKGNGDGDNGALRVLGSAGNVVTALVTGGVIKKVEEAKTALKEFYAIGLELTSSKAKTEKPQEKEEEEVEAPAEPDVEDVGSGEEEEVEE